MKDAATQSTPTIRGRWRSYSPNNRPRRRQAGSSRDGCRRKAILFVDGEPKVGKNLLVANLALALAAGKDRSGFTIPAARRVLVCQFELPTPQSVSRLASMRRSVGTAADQTCWWTPGPAAIYSARRGYAKSGAVLARGECQRQICHQQTLAHLGLAAHEEDAGRRQQSRLDPAGRRRGRLLGE